MRILRIRLFTFSHGGNRINKGGFLFDAASGPFKFQIGTLMWPCSTLKVCLKGTILNVAMGYLSVNS